MVLLNEVMRSFIYLPYVAQACIFYHSSDGGSRVPANGAVRYHASCLGER